MADNDPFDSPTTRRQREAARSQARRHHVKTSVAAVLIGVLVVLVALVVTDTIAVRGPRPHLRAAAADALALDAAGNADVSQLSHSRTLRPLSHDAPLRVWLGGDSQMGGLGDLLGPLLSNTGIVK